MQQGLLFGAKEVVIGKHYTIERLPVHGGESDKAIIIFVKCAIAFYDSHARPIIRLVENHLSTS